MSKIFDNLSIINKPYTFEEFKTVMYKKYNKPHKLGGLIDGNGQVIDIFEVPIRYPLLLRNKGILELTNDNWLELYEQYLREWDLQYKTVEYLKWRDSMLDIPAIIQPEYLEIDLQYEDPNNRRNGLW